MTWKTGNETFVAGQNRTETWKSGNQTCPTMSNLLTCQLSTI